MTEGNLEISPYVSLKFNQLERLRTLSPEEGTSFLGDSDEVKKLIDRARYSIWRDLEALGFGNEASAILGIDPNQKTTINDIMENDQ